MKASQKGGPIGRAASVGKTSPTKQKGALAKQGGKGKKPSGGQVTVTRIKT